VLVIWHHVPISCCHATGFCILLLVVTARKYAHDICMACSPANWSSKHVRNYLPLAWILLTWQCACEPITLVNGLGFQQLAYGGNTPPILIPPPRTGWYSPYIQNIWMTLHTGSSISALQNYVQYLTFCIMCYFVCHVTGLGLLFFVSLSIVCDFEKVCWKPMSGLLSHKLVMWIRNYLIFGMVLNWLYAMLYDNCGEWNGSAIIIGEYSSCIYGTIHNKMLHSIYKQTYQ
jgi:hypothetical protein